LGPRHLTDRRYVPVHPKLGADCAGLRHFLAYDTIRP
jgi:hypothetical protein